MKVKVEHLKKAIEYLERHGLKEVDVCESHPAMQDMYLSLCEADHQIFVYTSTRIDDHEGRENLLWKAPQVMRKENL